MLINNLSLHPKHRTSRPSRPAAELCHPTASCRCPPWIGWPHMRDIPLHKQNDCSIIYGTSPILAEYHMKSRNQQSIHLFCRFRLFRPSLHLTPAPNTHGPAGTVVALLVLAPAPGRHVDSDYLRGKSPTKSYGLPQVGDEKIDLLLLLLTKFHKSICRRKECHQYAELRLPLKCVSCKKNNNSIQPFIVSTFLQPTFHSLAPRLAIMRLLKVDPIGSRLVVELW